MYKLSFILLCFLLPNLLFAQKNKKGDYTFADIQPVVVDANVADWGNQLTQVPGDLWSFGLSLDGDQLFVAMVINDVQLQREAFRGGLFVDISYNGKKKEGARLQFPYWDSERRRAMANDEELRHKDAAMELIKNVNGYFLTGFARVRDGVLALENDYGVRAKATVDSNKCLIYEACIPLELIGLKDDLITVNLGVNTQYAMLKMAASKTNRNTNMYPMMYRSTFHTTLKKPYASDTDVWVYGKIKK